MQKVMDEYAGGIKSGYCYNEAGLGIAEQRIEELREMQKHCARSPRMNFCRFMNCGIV